MSAEPLGAEMFETKSVVLLLLVLVSTSCSSAGPNLANFDDWPTSSMGDGFFEYGATIDGEITWWKVPFVDVEKTPDWSPETEPPVSISEAVQLAEQEIQKYTDTPAAFRLDKVEWLNVTNCSSTKKWIYLVSFERVREFQSRKFESRGTIIIPVLLDRSVVQGSRRKPGA